MSSLETWRQEPPDFALVSKEEVVLQCHKDRLIDSSDYFKAMLSHKVRETNENRMAVPDYDAVTVASFLEWIYAAKLGEDVVKKLKQVSEPGEFISQRLFDQKKFSSELLKMSHLYQMSDLQSDCEDYLQQTVSKENVVEVWNAAGTSGSQKLREKALTTIARNLTEGIEIPGLKDQAIGLDEMMGWVMRHTTINEEEGKDEREADRYHVKVRFNSEIMTIYVKRDEAYESLKTKVATRIQRNSFILRKTGVGSPSVDWTVAQWGIPCMDWNLERWGIQNGQLLDVDLVEGTNEAAREGAGQYHVKVRFNSQIMTFHVNCGETYESLKRKVASRIQRFSFILRKTGVGFPNIDWTVVQWGIPCKDWNLENWGIQNGQLLDVDLMD